MSYKERYEQWLNDEFFDEATRKELEFITGEKEIEDRFYRDLEFGTGGLRGVMGAGTNRINKYTVGKATMGLGRYLLDTYGAEACKERGVVIGYDTRNNSAFFSRAAANVLSGMGIRVYLHAYARPTPQLSFSVKFWNTLAGVVVTASHNPKEYNGYKVYDEFGCQLVPGQAKQVVSYVDAITDYHTINFVGDDSLISIADVTDNYVMAVLKQSRYADLTAKQNLKIVYTPLHGTGNIPVQKALQMDGFTQIDAVVDQVNPDGDFPTVVSPNPEDRRALELGIAQAKRTGGDIVLGTDPDSDRVGIAVKTADGYQLMTGNQVGALLMNYILTHTDMRKYVDNTYYEAVKTLQMLAEQGAASLTLMGIEPTVPSEKYGYIIPESGESVSKVKEFKEKPDKETAKKYLAQKALWNAGIFAFKLGYLLDKAHSMIAFEDYRDLFNKYDTLTKISFDYAVVEKEPSIQVLRYSGDWKDVGTWNMMAEVMADKTKGKAILDETCVNTNVVNELNIPILCMGCKDLIVAASGDGILISDKERSGKMKPYVEKIETEAMYVEKSWGTYTVIDVQPGSMTVKVSMKAGQHMTYHMHNYREEVWTIVSGKGKAIVDGMEQILRAGDVITIAAGCKHTVEAITALDIVEVQLGEDISVADKIKFSDEIQFPLSKTVEV